MKIQMINLMLLLLITLSLPSCSKGDNKSSKNDSSTDAPATPVLPQVQPEDEVAEETNTPTAQAENIQGNYIAKFETLNPIIVGTIPGSAQFQRDENKLTAYLRLFAGSPDTAHFQNVHTGSRCPSMADDLNKDGILDYQEVLGVVGPIIIPLDWDIGTQSSGNISWPKAFPNGSYDYMKEANFERFLKNLRAEDRNPTDIIVKLKPEETFEITGKVVVIQGVAAEKVLPETVAGYGRWKNYQTLPIACGIFVPNTEGPGVYYDDSIEGPIAPVIEGQDQPAPDGADEIPGTGTVIEGPSNETGEDDNEEADDNTERSLEENLI